MSRKYHVAQLGARMHYAVPRILNKSGLLARFYTDIISDCGIGRIAALALRFYKSDGLRRLSQRNIDNIPCEIITTYPFLAASYAYSRHGCIDPEAVDNVYLNVGERFGLAVAKSLPKNVDGVFSFNSASEALFSSPKVVGANLVLEQTMAPFEFEDEVLRHEKTLHPDWGGTDGVNYHKSYTRKKLYDREKAEWDLADTIVCGSLFVRDKIVSYGGDGSKCIVVPYGVDFPNLQRVKVGKPGLHRPLRVLTVGAVGLRKGSPYVIEAAKRLAGVAEFVMVGPLNIPEEVAQDAGTAVRLVGPVPRPQVSDFYKWADVFLLPSLCEGSATATYEAMGYGLPIVCTENTGSIVQNDREGFIVPVRDTDAIVVSIEKFINNSELLECMGESARRTAIGRTLTEYGRDLIDLL